MEDQVRNIVEIWKINGQGKYWLSDSKDFSNDGMVEMSANGALHIKMTGVIKCVYYATFDSPIDCLIGFPAETLHKQGSSWQENGESNDFFLKTKSKRNLQGKQIIVETQYDFPADYTGPLYQARRIWFDSKTLQIQKVTMIFKNGKTDVGIFTYTKNQMKIDWTLRSGYLNQMNVNFF